MRQFLAQTPPDIFGVRLLINNLTILTESRFEVVTIRDISLSITTKPQLEGAVVDANGSLLGATLGDLGNTATYDQGYFKSHAYPEVNELMLAALNGETAVEKLSAKREEENMVIIAIPVYENTNRLERLPDDNILGAIIIVVKSLPSQEFLPMYILKLVSSSLVWFLIAAAIVGALFGFLTTRYFENRFQKLYIAANH